MTTEPRLMNLGRHVEHDSRSLLYPAGAATHLMSIEHPRIGPILDQGNVGDCTGNAMAGLLGKTEAVAIQLYSAATHLDRIAGYYPPNDTGSTGLAVAKAAQRAGYISSYRHAFGLEHALGAIQLAPVLVGINWYESFFKPDSDGQIHITPGAGVVGGHELFSRQIDVENRRVWLDNSWGPNWGVDGGRCFLDWDDFDQLLHEYGDVTVPVK